MSDLTFLRYFQPPINRKKSTRFDMFWKRSARFGILTGLCIIPFAQVVGIPELCSINFS
jgi:hypothetical protein